VRGDRPLPHALYRRWIVANGWSEALGLGTTFLVGRAAAPWLAASRPAGVLLSGVDPQGGEHETRRAARHARWSNHPTDREPESEARSSNEEVAIERAEGQPA
jgi:hypothetical protein